MMTLINVNTLPIDLTNQLVWNVRRGHGSFIIMGFGSPHLHVREPMLTSAATSSNVHDLLKYRRVSVISDWHFWITHSRWTLETHGSMINSDDQDVAKVVSALAYLDGQRLTSMSYKEDAHHLVFDLVGSLQIERLKNAEVDEDRWQIFEVGGNVLTCEYDGKLSYERRLSN